VENHICITVKTLFVVFVSEIMLRITENIKSAKLTISLAQLPATYMHHV